MRDTPIRLRLAILFEDEEAYDEAIHLRQGALYNQYRDWLEAQNERERGSGHPAEPIARRIEGLPFIHPMPESNNDRSILDLPDWPMITSPRNQRLPTEEELEAEFEHFVEAFNEASEEYQRRQAAEDTDSGNSQR